MARFDRVRDHLDYTLAVRLSQDVVVTPSPELCSDLSDFESGVWDEDFRKYPHRSYSFTLFGKSVYLHGIEGTGVGTLKPKTPLEGLKN
jgi:hypothetical protein